MWKLAFVAILLTSGSLAGEPAKPRSKPAKPPADVVTDAGAPIALRLKASATVRGDTATLADVLVLSQVPDELRNRISSQPVDANLRAPAIVSFSHAQISRRLEELGVNLARVMVVGASECALSLESSSVAATSDEPADFEGSQLLQPAKTNTTNSLGDFLRRELDREFSKSSSSAQIEFERAGREAIDLTSPPFSFRMLTPISEAARPGMRELRVVVEQDGKVVRTLRLFARISMVRSVVVAKRPMNVGGTVRREDLETQTRVFDDDTDTGVIEIDRLVGQQVRKFVPAGQMLRLGDLKAVDMVQRSKPITVVSRGAGVRVQSTGTAIDSGGFGDTIRVRLGDARREWREVRAKVVAAGKAELLENDE